MRTLHDFDNISASYLILIGIQGNGIAIFTSFVQCCGLAFYDLAMHAQHMKVFAFQTHNDTNVLGANKSICK